MNNEKPKKIFLSYAHEDIDAALSIYNDLKRYGLDVWIDCHDLKPGQRWKDKIEDTIEESAYFLFLLSSQSLNKRGFVQRELNFALEVLKECSEDHDYIIPARLDSCEPKNRILRNIQLVDLFPENEYQNGLRKILQVVSPGTFLLRSKPKVLSNTYVSNIILKYDFYDRDRNSEGKGIEHKYSLKKINNYNVVFDEATGLMWQQSGSLERLCFKDAEQYIEELNEKQFGGFNDWRLPTLEETMSLLEAKQKKYLHIDPIFDSKQNDTWTTDQLKDELDVGMAWMVYFTLGFCCDFPPNINLYVRAVRSGQSSSE